MKDVKLVYYKKSSAIIDLQSFLNHWCPEQDSNLHVVANTGP